MNSFQIAYTLWLAGVFILRGPSRAVWALAANLVVTLLACLMFDLGHIDRIGLTVSLMVIDVASGAALVVAPGLSRIVAVGYAVTVPIYSLNLLFGVQNDTTFAILYTVAAAQLGVVSIGNGNGGGNIRRRFDVGHSLAVSGGISEVVARGYDAPCPHVSQDRLK